MRGGACTALVRTFGASRGEDFGHVDSGTIHLDFGEAFLVAGVGGVLMPATVIL
jgi:hypothetical protein